MGNPSKQVTTAPPVPGVFSRMEDMEPPYSAPTYTPHRATKAVPGSRLYVSGSTRISPVAAPKPGRAPMMMPRLTVRINVRILMGCKTPSKPCKAMSSMESSKKVVQSEAGRAA